MYLGNLKIFRKAILMVHGFAGGTYDLEPLSNYLELQHNFDVFEFTLPGHDKALFKCNYEEWIDFCSNKIEWLINQGYDTIYVVGHSMGGVITTYLASQYKEIKKIVLLAPAFQYLKVKEEQLNVTDSIKTTPTLLKTYSADLIMSKATKFTPTAVKEFMTLVKKYYKTPLDVSCPVYILQGRNDNLVPVESALYVYDNVKSTQKRLMFVKDLTHEVCKGNDINAIFSEIKKFLKNGLPNGIYDLESSDINENR